MRSNVLHAAAMAAACAALIAPARAQAQDTPPTPPRYLGAPYNAPVTVRTGANDVFRATITARDGVLRGSPGGKPRVMPTVVYNGRINADLLRMDPGDSVDIVVRNSLRPDSANSGFVSWTNFHYHGFNVSPMPPADNVTFIRIGRDSSFHYQFGLPQSISPGLYWYHPHPHGISQMQLQRGMSGPISVGDVLAKVGYPSDIPERYLVFRDFTYFDTSQGFNSCWGPNQPYPLMNGQPLTHMTMRPGEKQFWRIANVGSDRVFNLKVRSVRGGRMPFRVIARDGNAVAEQYVTDSIYSVPGNRWEVLVTAPAANDTLELYSEAVLRNPANGATAECIMPRVTFGWITVEGRANLRAPRVALTTQGSPEQADTIRMLRMAAQVERDTLNFTQDSLFYINGITYDPSRIDKTIAIGRVQEWDLNNDSDDLHAFHIHQGDFLVVAERDSASTEWRPVTRKERLDTVFLPRGGGVRVRFVYTNPRLAGLFVYHCHMLFHEDRGM
ncbi:MAG TPA: multicopper oxidase family protein, partial [Longimicrobium sp.]|nr:multicopper oxidase family protein [Longimicrobium sp.]